MKWFLWHQCSEVQKEKNRVFLTDLRRNEALEVLCIVSTNVLVKALNYSISVSKFNCCAKLGVCSLDIVLIYENWFMVGCIRFTDMSSL